jgi:hypothetical protein
MPTAAAIARLNYPRPWWLTLTCTARVALSWPSTGPTKPQGRVSIRSPHETLWLGTFGPVQTGKDVSGGSRVGLSQLQAGVRFQLPARLNPDRDAATGNWP